MNIFALSDCLSIERPSVKKQSQGLNTKPRLAVTLESSCLMEPEHALRQFAKRFSPAAFLASLMDFNIVLGRSISPRK